MTETLEDTGHLLTTGVGAPFVVDRCDLAGCVRVLHYIDFRLVFSHGLQHILARPGLRWKSNGAGTLEHQARVSVFTGNSLAIEVFQQRDGVFSREASHLLEACHVECLATQFAYPSPQCSENALVQIQSVRAHFDQNLVAEQQSHEPAHLAIRKIQASRNFRGRGNREPSGLIGSRDCGKQLEVRIGELPVHSRRVDERILQTESLLAYEFIEEEIEY